MTTTEQPKRTTRLLDNFIDQFIDSGLTDPNDITAEALEKIPKEVIAEELLSLLRNAVRIRIRARMNNNPLNRDGKGRADRIREHTSQFLANPVRGEDGWKQLGACTFRDLMYAAGVRRNQAHTNLKEAKRYESLAHLLRNSNLTRVEQLRTEDIVACFA